MVDPVSVDILQVTLLSLYVSGSATILGSLIGIPLGALIGLKEFGGKAAIKVVTYTLYGFPPVISGLVVYYLFSRAGPLGDFGVLFTPTAMIIAQTLLIIPLTTGITISAVSEVDKNIKHTVSSLGATSRQGSVTIIGEAWVGVISAVMIGFGRAIAEVGAAYMVGGNIEGRTRILTTSIMMETRMGNFEFAVALGIVLLMVALGVFLLLHWVQERELL